MNDENKRDIVSVFRIFDPQREGFITIQEVGIAIRALDLQISKEELTRFGTASERIHQRPGFVSEGDFIKLAQSKMAARRPEDYIRSAFQLFENNGVISFEDLQRKSIEVGETLTDEEIIEMINEADTDGDGLVTESDFARLMGKARTLHSL